MAKYEVTEHENSEIDDKIGCTIVVSFDNPKYEAPHEEEYTVTDEDGNEQTETRTVESSEPETLTFHQEVYLPTGKAQAKAAQDYADEYEQEYLANQE